MKSAYKFLIFRIDNDAIVEIDQVSDSAESTLDDFLNALPND
jgi:hypothetical protein